MSATLVADNGAMGVFVFPSGTLNVVAVLDQAEVDNNGQVGVFVNGGATAGTLKATVGNSVVAGNGGTGVLSQSLGGTTEVMVRDSAISDNSIGVAAIGAPATLRVGRSTITGNGTGWAPISSGAVVSFGDNSLDGNSADGSPTITIALH